MSAPAPKMSALLCGWHVLELLNNPQLTPDDVELLARNMTHRTILSQLSDKLGARPCAHAP